MERAETIHILKEMKVTELAGEKVMIDFEAGKYYMIQGVGNVIWDMIQTDITFGEIIDAILKEYDVSREECETSVADFLNDLIKNGIIELR